MTTFIPDNRPLPAKKRTPDLRITTCKVCRAGVFEPQPKVWSRVPLGWIHGWCDE